MRFFALALVVIGSGCSCAEPDEGPPMCSALDGGAPPDGGAPARACDAPATVDPAAVASIEEFRAAASALACDVGLRCAGPVFALAQVYCHPEYAALEARRAGGDEAAFDADRGRTCLDALVSSSSCDAALEVLLTCRELSLGSGSGGCRNDLACLEWERCNSGRCVPRALGDACTDHAECLPGFECSEGACVAACSACEADSDCRSGLDCIDGTCRDAREGEPCAGLGSCADGLTCSANLCAPIVGPGDACVEDNCDLGVCGAEGVCLPQGHLGCPCASDGECPYDVARCVDGTCVARPMLGDACDEDGAACFGSTCDSGACRLMRQDEGPCGHDDDCEAGLLCSGTGFLSGLCGRPLLEGERCAGVGGRCERGLHCAPSEVCEPDRAVGESCSFEQPCEAGAFCNVDDVCETAEP